MEMTVRVQEGYQKDYCIVEGADGKFLRYRNHEVATHVLHELEKNRHSLPALTRQSIDVGRDWFGFNAVVTRPGRCILNGWVFTLDGNDDRVEAIGFDLEIDARQWLNSSFGIQA